MSLVRTTDSVETVTAAAAEEAEGVEEEEEGVVSLVVTPSNNCEGESEKYLGEKDGN